MRCSLGEDVLVRDSLVSRDELMGKALVMWAVRAEARQKGEVKERE